MLRRLWVLGLWSLLGLAAWPAWSGDCSSITPITQAQRQVWLDDRLHDQGAVTLPDQLQRPWRREGFRARYTLDVRACTTQAGHALWLFRVAAPYRLSIDGVATAPELPRTSGSAGSSFNGRTPMLFALPQGAREVSIELLTMPYIPAGVARAEIGPLSALLPLHLSAYNRHSGGMYVVSVVTVLVGLGTVLLWRTRRQDDLIFWFSMMCLTWGVRGLLYAGDGVHLPPLMYEQSNPFTVALFAVACFQTTLLLLNKQTPARHRALMGIGLGFTAAFAFTLAIGHGALPVRAASFLFGIAMLLVMPFLLWSGRSVLGHWRAGLIALGFVALFVGSLNDVLIVVGVLPPAQSSLILLGFSTVLLAYALVCAEYVMRALNQAETSNEALEARVREKSRELEHSYALLRESERASARAQERARFNREIHDGLGAQLMTALRGVERGALSKDQVAQSLQDGLDELRLLMDSADLGRSLHGALVAWRNRWDPRLQAVDMGLSWSIDPALEPLELNTDATLQIMRVLQEAVANAVKHARARNVGVQAVLDPSPPGALVLQVRDDGQGMPAEHATGPGGGRGLRNMRQRAERLGGTLEVGNAPGGGVLVRLHLPLPAAGEATNSGPLPLEA